MAYSRGSPLISTSANSNNGSADIAESVSELYETQLTRQCPNGRIPVSHSTESFGSRPGERTRQEQQQIMYENCKRLVAKNNKQQCAYNVLMFLCFLSTLVYIAVVIFLLSARSQTDVDSNPRSSSTTVEGQSYGGGQNEPHTYPFCVAQADIIAHEDLYSGIERKKAKDNICFSSLNWFRQVIQKVNSSIESRAVMIESKHQNMSEILDTLRTSVNGTRTTRLLKDSVPTLSSENLISSRQPVYAHLYLDISANHSNALIWTRPFIDQNSKYGIKVNSVTGELNIEVSGSYFVYSHVTFNKRTANHLSYLHRVVKNYRTNAKEVLLETDQGPASNLQGVFRLMVNDTLAVVATPDQFNTDSGRFTYFGTYLMRT